MRITGKFLLFFSSYLIAFIILLIIELPKLDLNTLLKMDYLSVNLPSILLVIFYVACILISIYSLITFKSTYDYPLPDTQMKISITSISNGASDLISYLLTIIIPIIGSGSLYNISFSADAQAINAISAGQYIRLLTILTIFVLIFLLYMNSSLIVINPMLTLIGYSLYKIEYRPKDGEIKIEGILLANSKFDPETLPDKVQVNRIDNQIFLYGRV